MLCILYIYIIRGFYTADEVKVTEVTLQRHNYINSGKTAHDIMPV